MHRGEQWGKQGLQVLEAGILHFAAKLSLRPAGALLCSRVGEKPCCPTPQPGQPSWQRLTRKALLNLAPALVPLLRLALPLAAAGPRLVRLRGRCGRRGLAACSLLLLLLYVCAWVWAAIRNSISLLTCKYIAVTTRFWTCAQTVWLPSCPWHCPAGPHEAPTLQHNQQCSPAGAAPPPHTLVILAVILILILVLILLFIVLQRRQQDGDGCEQPACLSLGR